MFQAQNKRSKLGWFYDMDGLVDYRLSNRLSALDDAKLGSGVADTERRFFAVFVDYLFSH